MRTPKLHLRRCSALPVSLSALAALLLLAGCAPEPLPHWQAPERDAVPGITLIATEADSGAETGTGGDETPQVTQTVPLQLTPKVNDLASIDRTLLQLRLRNDAVGISARFVAVPGVPAFTERVTAIVRDAIAATGVTYTPQVFGTDAGLDERGCVEGSTTWTAAEVLDRPETAPPQHSGTAITCEIIDAFADTLVITVRTVTGTTDDVRNDTKVTLSSNLATGEVTTGARVWRDTAPTELWNAVTELLRRDAGAIGTAALAAPTAEQTALVQTALDAAQLTTDGGIRVTLPPGLTSPELEGLGLDPSTEPVDVQVAPERAWDWATDHHRAVLSGTVPPFSGVTRPWQSVPVDCTLLPCVAVTYDDGPGPLTPRLLEQLRDTRGLATFYMLGNAAQGAPNVVRAVAKDGHEIGSHTMNHPELTLIEPAAAREQVHQAAQILREHSGQPVATYRPPYGSVSAEVQQAVEMPAILWNIDTNDWQRPGPEALIERSVPAATSGSIILFHDIHQDTVDVAGTVFQGLHARGFQTVTVSQLFDGTVPLEVVRAR